MQEDEPTLSALNQHHAEYECRFHRIRIEEKGVVLGALCMPCPAVFGVG